MSSVAASAVDARYIYSGAVPMPSVLYAVLYRCTYHAFVLLVCIIYVCTRSCPVLAVGLLLCILAIVAAYWSYGRFGSCVLYANLHCAGCIAVLYMRYARFCNTLYVHSPLAKRLPVYCEAAFAIAENNKRKTQPRTLAGSENLAENLAESQLG